MMSYCKICIGNGTESFGVLVRQFHVSIDRYYRPCSHSRQRTHSQQRRLNITSHNEQAGDTFTCMKKMDLIDLEKV